ncbi:MAG: DNA polymerase IV [Deltaproteobacteria bacterium]|nr:DNA polymerase IV [Deltaproteobacteria bacterium]
MDRHIIHLHIPSFPIAVARVVRPELRDRPVAVAPPHSERALLVSVSAEARQQGIFKGMPLAKAIKFCPGLTVLPPDHDLTAKACQVLAGVVARYTPLWEPSHPGHIYLDVTGTDRLWGRAKDAANRLRREIKEQARLSGTVGVASNKMVSSIASRVIQRDGVLDVDHGREPSFMAPLKVNVLPGIGPVRRRILLEELNITLVRQIVALDMGSLKLVFGQQAYVIHRRALGIDPTPVFPPSTEPTVAEEVSLPQDENDDEKLLGVLYGLVEKCSYQLRTRSLLPRKAGITFRYTDQEEVTRQVQIPKPSFWEFELYAPLEAAFLKACRRRVRVRFMKIWFKDFSAPSAQLSLFAFAPQSEKKKTQVIGALDRIREKHGEALIQSGRTTASHHRGSENTEGGLFFSPVPLSQAGQAKIDPLANSS